MWNADIELATLMKALNGLPNNDALMRVLESNQRLLLSVAPFHWVLPATTSKENNYLQCWVVQHPLQVWPWNQSSAGQQDNPQVCDIKTNKTTWVNSFTTWHPGHPCLVCLFFFPPSNYPRKKSHSLQGWIFNKNIGFTSSFATGWLQDLEKDV